MIPAFQETQWNQGDRGRESYAPRSSVKLPPIQSNIQNPLLGKSRLQASTNMSEWSMDKFREETTIRELVKNLIRLNTDKHDEAVAYLARTTNSVLQNRNMKQHFPKLFHTCEQIKTTLEYLQIKTSDVDFIRESIKQREGVEQEPTSNSGSKAFPKKKNNRLKFEETWLGGPEARNKMELNLNNFYHDMIRNNIPRQAEQEMVNRFSMVAGGELKPIERAAMEKEKATRDQVLDHNNVKEPTFNFLKQYHGQRKEELTDAYVEAQNGKRSREDVAGLFGFKYWDSLRYYATAFQGGFERFVEFFLLADWGPFYFVPVFLMGIISLICSLKRVSTLWGYFTVAATFVIGPAIGFATASLATAACLTIGLFLFQMMSGLIANFTTAFISPHSWMAHIFTSTMHLFYFFTSSARYVWMAWKMLMNPLMMIETIHALYHLVPLATGLATGGSLSDLTAALCESAPWKSIRLVGEGIWGMFEWMIGLICSGISKLFTATLMNIFTGSASEGFLEYVNARMFEAQSMMFSFFKTPPSESQDLSRFTPSQRKSMEDLRETINKTGGTFSETFCTGPLKMIGEFVKDWMPNFGEKTGIPQTYDQISAYIHEGAFSEHFTNFMSIMLPFL